MRIGRYSPWMNSSTAQPIPALHYAEVDFPPRLIADPHVSEVFYT